MIKNFNEQQVMQDFTNTFN